MKKSILVLAGLVVFPLMAASSPVTFKIENIENKNGKILVGIYRQGEFLKKGKIWKGCASVGKLESHQVQVQCDLEPGKYAAAIFHDENNNAELDTNFIGMPKEGFGFSNNPKMKFGPPSFNDAAFEVTEPAVEVKVKLSY